MLVLILKGKNLYWDRTHPVITKLFRKIKYLHNVQSSRHQLDFVMSLLAPKWTETLLSSFCYLFLLKNEVHCLTF